MASRPRVPLLLEGEPFPDPSRASAEGLVAVGGSMTVERLLEAYRAGIFPWTHAPVTWWSPDPRAIFPLGESHIPRSLKKVLNAKLFSVTLDRAFEQVMRACAAAAPGRSSTWITQEFIDAYTRLHSEGHAHSLECWQQDELVGGIYGVSIGGFFAGESMFHRVSNASKIALVELARHLHARDFLLFDIQMLTPVTTQLGGQEISRDEYLRRLKNATEADCSFCDAPRCPVTA